jgi:hypothetical protein
MSKVSDIHKAMERAAYALDAIPVEEWAEWVVYLLETLEEGVDDEKYRDFLDALRQAITRRLEEGLW